MSEELHLTFEIKNALTAIEDDLHEAMRDYLHGIADANEVEHEVQRLENWLRHFRQLNPKP